MNLNYDNLNIESISEETRAKYAFPEDKVFLRKYMKGELQQTHKEVKKNQEFMTALAYGSIISLGAGAYGYVKLLNPAGKVLRDAYDASLPMWKRITRRVVPFGLLALPFVVLREMADAENNYNYKSWIA